MGILKLTIITVTQIKSDAARGLSTACAIDRLRGRQVPRPSVGGDAVDATVGESRFRESEDQGRKIGSFSQDHKIVCQINQKRNNA